MYRIKQFGSNRGFPSVLKVFQKITSIQTEFTLKKLKKQFGINHTFLNRFSDLEI